MTRGMEQAAYPPAAAFLVAMVEGMNLTLQ